jgi:hypothetical protein
MSAEFDETTLNLHETALQKKDMSPTEIGRFMYNGTLDAGKVNPSYPPAKLRMVAKENADKAFTDATIRDINKAKTLEEQIKILNTSKKDEEFKLNPNSLVEMYKIISGNLREYYTDMSVETYEYIQDVVPYEYLFKNKDEKETFDEYFKGVKRLTDIDQGKQYEISKDEGVFKDDLDKKFEQIETAFPNKVKDNRNWFEIFVDYFSNSTYENKPGRKQYEKNILIATNKFIKSIEADPNLTDKQKTTYTYIVKQRAFNAVVRDDTDRIYKNLDALASRLWGNNWLRTDKKKRYAVNLGTKEAEKLEQEYFDKMLDLYSAFHKEEKDLERIIPRTPEERTKLKDAVKEIKLNKEIAFNKLYEEYAKKQIAVRFNLPYDKVAELKIGDKLPIPFLGGTILHYNGFSKDNVFVKIGSN